jgi:hypothetical protein
MAIKKDDMAKKNQEKKKKIVRHWRHVAPTIKLSVLSKKYQQDKFIHKLKNQL